MAHTSTAERGTVMVAHGLVKCDGCEGCGYVADTSRREPWTSYAADPSKLFVDIGGMIVLRIYCGKCKGTGRTPAWRRSLHRPKRERG